jgi:uroporphyrinogen decarboxylase
MNSRERFKKALNFAEPDRVPVDWGGNGLITGIHEIAYRNLLKYLGKDEEIVLIDYVQRLAKPSEEILDMFGVDTEVILTNSSSKWKYEPEENGNWYDEFGTYWVRSEYYCDSKKYPLENAVSINDLNKYKMPDPADHARFKGLREKAKNLYENTGKALVGGNVPSLHSIAWGLRGYQNFMTDLAGNPKFANYILDMILDWNIALMHYYLKEIGDYIEMMCAGDDFGTQYGPFMNPESFRRDTVPRFKKLITSMKEKSKAKVFFHTCGATRWCFDDLIEMGVDVIHPLQANAAGNENSKEIKKLIHGRLTVHGGLDNQGKFHLSKEIVANDVKQKIKDFAPGGGYLFGCGHNIQPNCPPENIMAIFDTFREYRNYPINVI